MFLALVLMAVSIRVLTLAACDQKSWSHDAFQLSLFYWDTPLAYFEDIGL